MFSLKNYPVQEGMKVISHDCELYPVRVITNEKVQEISVREVRKHHWEEFEKQSVELASIRTNSKIVKVQAQIRRERGELKSPVIYDE